MALLKKAEDQIGGLFKDLPNLPSNSKDALVKVWPWLALIFGVLQLVAAWGLYKILDNVLNPLVDYVNTLAVYTGQETVGYSSFDKAVIYLGIAILIIDGIILLMAYPHLVKRARRGWDLLFLGSLLNLLYAVVTIFIDSRGFGSFVFSLIGSAIGFYLLFQIRDRYKGKSLEAKKA
jgi:glucan phosphoethanolaminetransferase (alkaline phosphatase superfamily)